MYSTLYLASNNSHSIYISICKASYVFIAIQPQSVWIALCDNFMRTYKYIVVVLIRSLSRYWKAEIGLFSCPGSTRLTRIPFTAHLPEASPRHPRSKILFQRTERKNLSLSLEHQGGSRHIQVRGIVYSGMRFACGNPEAKAEVGNEVTFVRNHVEYDTCGFRRCRTRRTPTSHTSHTSQFEGRDEHPLR